MGRTICPGPGNAENCENPGCRHGGCQGRTSRKSSTPIVCRIGFKHACPYQSCELAQACMAPVPANDNEAPVTRVDMTIDEFAAFLDTVPWSVLEEIERAIKALIAAQDSEPSPIT